MEGKVNIAIIHYNTPLLTECLVKSINKFTPNSNIYIFDNSDKDPFTYRQDNITYFDNTKGEIVNFSELLGTFKLSQKPEENGKYAGDNKYGSIKHTYSIQKCIDLIGENFILLDSDVLLKKNISSFADETCIYVGNVSNSFKSTYRVLPYILFINVNMCREYGISFFNEDYMYGIENNPDSTKYDTGGWFYFACENIPHKIVKHKSYVVHFQAGSWMKDAIDNQNYHPIMTEQKWLSHYSYLYTMNKKVIYTCITGNYEPLDDPFEISEGYDYICFTDGAIKSKVWKVLPIPAELRHLTPVKQQRCIKINPHLYLPGYDFSIWVDGSIKLTKDVNEFVEKNCSDGSVFIPEHPQRNCIYDEMVACVKQKKDIEQNIAPQRIRYRAEKFPEKYGLVQSNIVIRRHNDPCCIKLMETWWSEVKKGSHRDQLSFDYARWKNKNVKFTFLDKRTCNSDYFKWDKSHGKGKKPFVVPKKKVEMVKILGYEPVHKKEEPKRIASSEIAKQNPTIRRRMVSNSLKTFLKP